MSTGILIDTYETIQNYKAAGFNEKQAEALLEPFKHIQGDLATKADLKELEIRLNSKIDELRIHFKYFYIMGAGIFGLLVVPYIQHLLQLINK